MTTTAEVALFARVCHTTNDPCSLCGHWRERTLGMTETYLVDSDCWVCEDCAFEIDADLARFAYGCGLEPTKPRVFPFEHFGACPECGHANTLMNIHKTHWFYCPRHGLRWCVGYNLISSWEFETESDWLRNEASLLRMREVEPYYPEPEPSRPSSLPKRIVIGLKQFWATVRATDPDQSNDDCPF